LKRILIVEDDDISATLLKAILAPHGACDVAADGGKAVKTFKAKAEKGEPYDLICLDIMLPVMDGQDVLKAIRGWEAEKGVLAPDGVPIIMITALRDKENVMGAFKSQCEGYIVKPIRKAAVVAQLNALGLIG
jgi:two-component system chemotaxis response regulator CheY